MLDVGEYFQSWEYVETAKNEGGKIYITCARDGTVTFYEGQLPRKEAQARLKADGGEAEEATTQPELTQPMQRYLALHRHSAVRSALVDNKTDGGGIALRLAVAQIIAGSDLWHVHAEPRKAGRETIAESLATNKAEVPFATERTHIRALLGWEDESADDGKGDAEETIIPCKGDWQSHRDLHAIFARLLTLDDAEVNRILVYVVAESLPCGSPMVEILAPMLKVDMAASWTPDEAFFDLLRDKEAINAMLAEIAGKATADAHIAATAKAQKGIIADCLTGKRKPTAENWAPRYMAVPMTAYTKRGGITAIDGLNAA